MRKTQPPFSCKGCDVRWDGYTTTHCGACHKTFSSLSSFDKHRTGSYVKSTRTCIPPVTAGLSLTNREYECYCLPGENPRQRADDVE